MVRARSSRSRHTAGVPTILKERGTPQTASRTPVPLGACVFVVLVAEGQGASRTENVELGGTAADPHRGGAASPGSSDCSSWSACVCRRQVRHRRSSSRHS